MPGDGLFLLAYVSLLLRWVCLSRIADSWAAPSPAPLPVQHWSQLTWSNFIPTQKYFTTHIVCLCKIIPHNHFSWNEMRRTSPIFIFLIKSFQWKWNEKYNTYSYWILWAVTAWESLIGNWISIAAEPTSPLFFLRLYWNCILSMKTQPGWCSFSFGNFSWFFFPA